MIGQKMIQPLIIAFPCVYFNFHVPLSRKTSILHAFFSGSFPGITRNVGTALREFYNAVPGLVMPDYP